MRVIAVAWIAVAAAGALMFRPRRRILPAPPDGSHPHLTTLGMGLAAGALFVVMAQWLWAGLVLGGAFLAVAMAATQREQRVSELAVNRELPEVIELLQVCAEGGLNVRNGVEWVARITPGRISEAFAAASRATAAGASLADALEDCTRHLGASARALVSALAATERYGVALVPSLERLAVEARAEERRRGETDARKVPVKLLFPLVLCILPAFALLTVAPLIAGGIESLRLP